MLDRDEVVAGLALLLDPSILLGNYATFDGPIFAATRLPHYFVCQDIGPAASVWMPTSSKPGWGRQPVRSKIGGPEWVRTPTYALEDQQWRVDFTGLRLASCSDRTRRGFRNFAVLDFVVLESMAA
jgi:hypothetical protein